MVIVRDMLTQVIAALRKCSHPFQNPPRQTLIGAIFLLTLNDLIPMLKHTLIHPKINEVLGRAGHHARILIADGNYPASSTLGPNAELVSLNLMPGLVSCTQVLEALLSAIPVETARTMQPETSGPYAMTEDPPNWAEYRRILNESGQAVTLEPVEKWDFYKEVNTNDHVLTIQTADQGLFANLLLSVGVRQA